MPGGYLGREKLREADVLIRRYAASRIDEAVSRLEEARGFIASRESEAFFSNIPGLTPAPVSPSTGLARFSGVLEQLSLEAQKLASDILYADSGWAPVSAVQAIREEELRRLCEYDDTLIGLSEGILVKASELLDATRRGDTGTVERVIDELRDAIRTARRVYEERVRFLRFAGAGGESVLEKAKSLLSRLFQRSRSP